MANKKIVVLKLRELIYTGIFLFFGVILILLLVAMFSGGKSDVKSDVNSDSTTDTGEVSAGVFATGFLPGLYTADLTLAEETCTLTLLVDANRVTALYLTDLQPDTAGTGTIEYVATMYPLVEPALETIENSLMEGIPPAEIVFSVENQYTGRLLCQALEALLAKAMLPATAE